MDNLLIAGRMMAKVRFCRDSEGCNTAARQEEALGKVEEPPVAHLPCPSSGVYFADEGDVGDVVIPYIPCV